MPAWYLLLALAFIVANGFFVAAEFAMVKVRPTQLAELTAKGSSRARMTRRLLKRLDAYLAACQVGITIASLGLGWIGEPAFAKLLMPLFPAAVAHSIAAAIAFALISTLHIVFGEQVPKFLSIEKPVGVALSTAHLLHAFYIITFPAIWFLRGMTNAGLRLFRIPVPTEPNEVRSEEELRAILAHSEKTGVLSEEN